MLINLFYGGGPLFDIEIKKRKVKSITLKIDRNGKIFLTVPTFLTKKEINEFLKSRESWLKEKMENFEKKEKPHSPLRDDFFYFLGEKKSISEIYEIDKKFLDEDSPNFVSDKKKLDHFKQYAVRKYFSENSQTIITPIVKKYLSLMKLEAMHISYKPMKSRWGSCNSKQKYLNFNSILISSPIESIEYVVVHEIVHLIYPHHRKEFWHYVEKFIPDWEIKRKNLLFFEI